MFSESKEYDLRVFLSSYEDALHCLKQSADKAQLRNNYENIANRLTIYVKQKKMFANTQPTINEEKEIQAFRYTHYIFLKYIPDFDNFKGDYQQLQSLLNNSINLLQKEYNQHQKRDDQIQQQ